MPILGMSDLLESRFRQEKTDTINLIRGDFEIISRNSRRLERLAVDILDVSRIETRSLVLHIDSFDLLDLVQHSVSDIKNLFPKAGIEYQVDVEKGIALRADKSKMGQVLWNLVHNATKFTDEGVIRITCRVTSDAPDAEESDISISVSDTGTGIDPELLARLFTKFTSKAGLSRDQVGSGLGLYISRGIVEAHGGKIWAENNRDGRGCTFYILIPSSHSIVHEKC
jgi:signal transduction histidine kinase